MESQPAAFYEAVRKGYLELAAGEEGRFLVIDASKGVEAIADEIRRAVERRLESDGIFG